MKSRLSRRRTRFSRGLKRFDARNMQASAREHSNHEMQSAEGGGLRILGFRCSILFFTRSLDPLLSRLEPSTDRKVLRAHASEGATSYCLRSRATELCKRNINKSRSFIILEHLKLSTANTKLLANGTTVCWLLSAVIRMIASFMGT
jgi:hypothetical protein